MNFDLSRAQLNGLRLQNQYLADFSRSSATATVVLKLCALQSQEWSSAQLAIAARASGITQADVKRAREIERSFVLTWTLRGTLHLVSAEDLGWQLALCADRAIRATNRRYQQLGLTKAVREAALDAITEILSQHEALTRAQLAHKLAACDIPVAGQAIHHLVRFAALRGVICFGPEKDGDLTYVLLKSWLPDFQPAPYSDDLLPQLARRYLAAYGPAASNDLAHWAGLSASQAKAAFSSIAAECAAVAMPGGGGQILQHQLDELNKANQANETPALRFLARYDNYLLAYHQRDFMVDPAFAKAVMPGGGLIRACVIIDGIAKANWKLEKRRNRDRLVIAPFETLDRSLLPQLEDEAAALAEFLGRDIELQIEEE